MIRLGGDGVFLLERQVSWRGFALLGFVFNLQNVRAKFSPLCCHFLANRITFQKKTNLPFLSFFCCCFLGSGIAQ